METDWQNVEFALHSDNPYFKGSLQLFELNCYCLQISVHCDAVSSEGHMKPKQSSLNFVIGV